MKFKWYPFLLLSLVAFLYGSADAWGDDLFISSGRTLKAAQRAHIEDRIKKLRDSDYKTRFEVMQYLIDLDRTAVPIVLDDLARNSNPMPVRCMLLALSEIGGPEAVDRLNGFIGDSQGGRDETMSAALGLGKLEGGVDLDRLRALLDHGSNRDLKKAATLALARKKDAPSTARMLKYIKTEKNREFSALLILAACMIGGEEVSKEMPRLFKSAKEERRRLLTLGATFLGEPVLLPVLMKYGTKSDKIAPMLAVCLGRYHADEAVPFLEKIIKGADARAAEDALYSLARQDQGKAAAHFEAVLDHPRFPSVKAHCLLALAEVGRAQDYPARVHEALQEPDPSVRSAAALSLRHSRSGETPMRLGEALRAEGEPAVAGDILLAVGLVGGSQYLEAVQQWMERRQASPELKRTAGRVYKVLTGKMDPAILNEQYEDRLSQLSARWHFRFRDRVMEEVYRGFELDKIIRRRPLPDGSGGGESSSGSGGESGDSGDSGNDSGDGGDTGDTGDAGGEAAEAAVPADDTGPGKKFQFRHEVYEWDLLQWFDHYPYFPEACFSGGDT